MRIRRRGYLLLVLVTVYRTNVVSTYRHGEQQADMFRQLLQAIIQDAYYARQQSIGLHMETITNSKIQGMYRDSVTGEGIHFSTSVNENGGGEMTIATLQGEPIVVAKQSHSDGAKLMSVEGKHFLITKDHQFTFIQEGRSEKESEFVVSNARLQEVQVAIQDHSGAHVSRILKHLDSTTADTKREKALHNFISRAETQLIINAAKALGKSGVSGKHNDAARIFFVHAMRLEGARMKADLPVHVQSHYAYISNKRSCEKCPKGNCPQKEDQCRGMCGPSCWWCWHFICGDCCIHQGCTDHDDCCEKNGYLSWACFFPFFRFQCAGPYYNCP